MEYESLGDEISVEAAIVQAAHALDIACTLATESRNTDALMKTVEHWQKLAGFIMDVSEHMGDDSKEKASFKTGFQPNPVEDKEDEDARDEQD
jgi:phage-related tail protein